jgi:hypothetical protein
VARKENTFLKAKLEQLETQQQFNSNLHSPKVIAAIDLTSSYQLAIGNKPSLLVINYLLKEEDL